MKNTVKWSELNTFFKCWVFELQSPLKCSRKTVSKLSQEQQMGNCQKQIPLETIKRKSVCSCSFNSSSACKFTEDCNYSLSSSCIANKTVNLSTGSYLAAFDSAARGKYQRSKLKAFRFCLHEQHDHRRAAQPFSSEETQHPLKVLYLWLLSSPCWDWKRSQAQLV